MTETECPVYVCSKNACRTEREANSAATAVLFGLNPAAISLISKYPKKQTRVLISCVIVTVTMWRRDQKVRKF